MRRRRLAAPDVTPVGRARGNSIGGPRGRPVETYGLYGRAVYGFSQSSLEPRAEVRPRVAPRIIPCKNRLFESPVITTRMASKDVTRAQ